MYTDYYSYVAYCVVVCHASNLILNLELINLTIPSFNIGASRN